jgi:hypothetical protein
LGLYLESTPWHPPLTPPDVLTFTDATSKVGGCATAIITAAKIPNAMRLVTIAYVS